MVPGEHGRCCAVTQRLLLALLALFLPAAAQAATCTISATGVSFGTYVPSNESPTDITGTVTVTCSSTTNQTVSYTIALNAGVNSGSSFSNRRMTNGATFLSYQLYTNSARTTVWGDGTGGTSTVTGSFRCNRCTNTKRNSTDYGRLPGLQWSAAPGLYSDTITATVTFN